MKPVSIDQIRDVVRRTHEPQFMLPARFNHVSFESFQLGPENIAQRETIDQLRAILAESGRSLRFWQKRAPEIPRGVYMMGPPGIGKTHLLAATFHSASEPKLFATFDEFLAAVGTMGMEALAGFLTRHRVVCIDEIDLDDPANIMMLNSMLRIMLTADLYVIATANARPGGMAGGRYYQNPFTRELGEIAGSFSIVELDGQDWRETGQVTNRHRPRPDRVVRFHWDELMTFLRETHPMYDARWLLEVDGIELDRIQPLTDRDQAIRFVRLIDRVYDRDIQLMATGEVPPVDTILTPIQDEARFRLHFIRCRSRLTELLGVAVS